MRRGRSSREAYCHMIKGRHSGTRLRDEREARGLSVRALARLADVAPSTVLRWESMVRLPKAPTVALRLIAKALRLRIFVRSGPRRRVSAFEKLLARTLTQRSSDPCSARTRSGGECQNRPLPGKRRCRFHGGLSTGPRTVEGKARCSQAAKRRWEEQNARTHTSEE